MAYNLLTLKRGAEFRAPRIIMHGFEAIGKTTFAASMPNPVFINTDREFGDLDITRFVFDESGREVAESMEDVLDAICWLGENEHDRKTVVIDHFSGIEKLIVRDLCTEYKEPNIHGRSSGSAFAFETGAKLVAAKFEELTKYLNRLNEQRNMTVMCLAHTHVQKFKSPDTDDYDYYEIGVEKKYSADVLKKWADMILFATLSRPLVQLEDQGFAKKKGKVKDPREPDRIIYTEKRYTHTAKNRYSLPYELPFPRENAWQVVEEAMLANSNRTAPEPAAAKTSKRKNGRV